MALCLFPLGRQCRTPRVVKHLTFHVDCATTKPAFSQLYRFIDCTIRRTLVHGEKLSVIDAKKTYDSKFRCSLNECDDKLLLSHACACHCIQDDNCFLWFYNGFEHLRNLQSVKYRIGHFLISQKSIEKYEKNSHKKMMWDWEKRHRNTQVWSHAADERNARRQQWKPSDSWISRHWEHCIVSFSFFRVLWHFTVCKENELWYMTTDTRRSSY